ncbi:MAG: tetratricopeptide repeat protein [Methyloceanibacter sp.]|nr:tetratricopeptide repeat protein [Methyloceanibacter sp.]
MMKSILLATAVASGLTFGMSVPASAQALERAMATYYRGDYAEAIKAMTPFAKEGDRYALFMIGFMHERGQGVPQDYAEAAKWYGQAAELGHPNAQNNLGVLFKNGRGVPKDPVSAYKWFSLAADGYQPAEIGHRERALSNKQEVAGDMSSEQLAEARQQIESYRAADPGLPEYRAPNVR